MENIIKEIIKYKNRQGVELLEVQEYIQNILNINNIPFVLNEFKSVVPKCEATLIVDGLSVECRGCSYIGGKINSKSCILSSTTPSRFNLDNTNINFNPYSDAVSCSNFYFAPAIAVSRNDISKIINAKNIEGEVRVEKIETNVAHILVGNFKNPKNIIFAHFDSISIGAIDNASGVAVALSAIIQNPEILKESLFVFDPNEELSYDKPTYWGHGFRVFEEKYSNLFDEAEKIIPIDCVGNGPVVADSNPEIIYLAFPIKEFDKYKNKMITIYSDIDQLMTVYHSDADVLSNLDENKLKEAQDLLLSLL
ncbi:MAG: hypothetical protein KBD26_01630 [Candidatus Pacebacteria bacterium]|nr:hypothetical protein [Candidatus Paceibacterota bacterium]MBP9772511.1 hypothetical protein [Candidatus Paceibacterota bacterium]